MDRTRKNELEIMDDLQKKTDSTGYFQFGEVFGYFFRKKDKTRKSNINLRLMHGINKISILIFLAGIIYLIIKNIF